MTPNNQTDSAKNFDHAHSIQKQLKTTFHFSAALMTLAATATIWLNQHLTLMLCSLFATLVFGVISLRLHKSKVDTQLLILRLSANEALISQAARD